MRYLSILSISFLFVLNSWAAGDVLLEAIAPGKTVAVKRGTSVLALAVGEKLLTNDEVQTKAGESVDIRYPDGSLVRVGAQSNFKLEQGANSDTYISRLQTGLVRVMVKAQKEKKEIKFRMRTPTGTIGVRGTEFLLAYQARLKLTLLQTLKGEVLLAPANQEFENSTKWVPVKKGEESYVGEKGVPGAPKKFDLKKKQMDLLNPEAIPAFAGLANRAHGVVPVVASTSANTAAKATEPEAEKNTPKVMKVEAAVKISSKQKLNKQLVEAVLAKSANKAIDLLQLGADPNQVLSAESRDSLLHGAAVMNELQLIQALVDKGARINVVNVLGNSALMELVASQEIKMETVQLLVENEINLLLTNANKETAVAIAKANTDADNAKEIAAYLEEQTKLVIEKSKRKK